MWGWDLGTQNPYIQYKVLPTKVDKHIKEKILGTTLETLLSLH